MVNKVYGLLGISSKAGKVISGTEVVLEEIRKHKVALVIVAEDAAERTIKNVRYECEKNNVNIEIFGNIFENSKYIGKQNRAVIGIKDKNLALAIEKIIHGGDESGKNQNS